MLSTAPVSSPMEIIEVTSGGNTLGYFISVWLICSPRCTASLVSSRMSSTMTFPAVPLVISIDSMMFTPERSSRPKVLEKLAIEVFCISGPKMGRRSSKRSMMCRPFGVR